MVLMSVVVPQTGFCWFSSQRPRPQPAALFLCPVAHTVLVWHHCDGSYVGRDKPRGDTK